MLLYPRNHFEIESEGKLIAIVIFLLQDISKRSKKFLGVVSGLAIGKLWIFMQTRILINPIKQMGPK